MVTPPPGIGQIDVKGQSEEVYHEIAGMTVKVALLFLLCKNPKKSK